MPMPNEFSTLNIGVFNRTSMLNIGVITLFNLNISLEKIMTLVFRQISMCPGTFNFTHDVQPDAFFFLQLEYLSKPRKHFKININKNDL